MKTILIPIDFSENASNALEYAVETARAVNASISVLHIYNPPVSAQSVIRAVVAEDISRATKVAREKLIKITETITTEYPMLACSYEIVVGDTVSEILRLAKQKNADLIVMGTRGASKVSNVLFGSNTAAIIEKSECPVLCIPQNLPFRIPEKILYATNFSFSDIESSSKLVEIGKAFGSFIVFGHVVVGIEETDEERKLIDKFAKEIRLNTGYEKISGMVISDATVTTGIDLLIEKSGVDMIALSTRKRSLFGKFYNPSITKKFSYYATIPLLAFHLVPDEEQTERDI